MVRKNGLPRRVYERHGAWYFVSLANKWHRLCAVRDGLPAMYRALADLQEADSSRGDLMPGVIAKWLTAKRPTWSAAHEANAERMASVVSTAFAEFAPRDVTTPDCAEFLARYADKPRTHNIYRDILRQVLAFAAVAGLREGYNPVDNIKGRSTPGRHRVVSDAEIDAIKAACVAGARADGAGRALAQMIDLALITGQRIGDLRRLRWQDVTADGIQIEQGKTGAKMLIEWSPALRAAVDACAAGTDRVGHLLKTRSGSPYTYSGIKSAWQRICAKAGVEDLNIHDLRGRAGVDAMQAGGMVAAQGLLGHAGERMTAHYVAGKFLPRVKPAK